MLNFCNLRECEVFIPFYSMRILSGELQQPEKMPFGESDELTVTLVTSCRKIVCDVQASEGGLLVTVPEGVARGAYGVRVSLTQRNEDGEIIFKDNFVVTGVVSFSDAICEPVKSFGFACYAYFDEDNTTPNYILPLPNSEKAVTLAQLKSVLKCGVETDEVITKAITFVSADTGEDVTRIFAYHDEDGANVVEFSGILRGVAVPVEDTDAVNKKFAEELVEKAPKIINTTHAELKSMRDAGELVGGQQYQITDYHCTTTQEDTASAGHDFDIIVTATSANTLSEDAKAVQHEGDEYFNNCNLGAWEVKYCLDNDANRFAWADTENGKGVIYRLIDEWRNDCPYDFKNIMFKRYFDEDARHYKKGESDNNKWCYTFCMLDFYDGNAHDVTVEQEKYISFYENLYYRNFKNVIMPFDKNNSLIIEGELMKGRYTLNDNVFVTDTNICSISEDYSKGTFKGYYSNTFGNNCYQNTFGNNCCYNTFGNNCYQNIFGSDCYSNKFGNKCYHNTFSNNCYQNTFGTYCYYNTFGINCYQNTFGNNCYYNTFGTYCYYNTFINNCNNNTFGNSCVANKFGINCSRNRFGNSCGYNTFINDCSYITFGNNVLPQNNTRYVTIMTGVKNLFITCSQTLTSSAYCQNVIVNSGIAGQSQSNRKILTVATANNAFLTTFGSANDVVINV